MFCFGVGVKDSPNLKISISSSVSGRFDIFKIFVDCDYVIVGSCNSRFQVTTVNLTVFSNQLRFFQHILQSYQFHLNPVLLNVFQFYQCFLVNFKNRLGKQYPNGTRLCIYDIKSLYTKIQGYRFYTAVKYQIEKLQNDLTLLQHFNKQFIPEGLSIILEFNYFLHKRNLYSSY